jgi:hypothetical protein
MSIDPLLDEYHGLQKVVRLGGDENITVAEAERRLKEIEEEIERRNQ